MISDERLTEMIDGMKLYADIPYGIKINEFSAKDLYSSLLELESRRESDLRPCDKFLANSITEQLNHLISELLELENEVDKSELCADNSERIAEELIDLQVSAQTMLGILGFTGEKLRGKRLEVVEKNRARGYYAAMRELEANNESDTGV